MLYFVAGNKEEKARVVVVKEDGKELEMTSLSLASGSGYEWIT